MKTLNNDILDLVHEHYIGFAIWLKRMDEITFATSYSDLFSWFKSDETSANISEYHIDDLYRYWLFYVKNNENK